MSIYNQRTDLLNALNKELECITIPQPHRVKILKECIKRLLKSGTNPEEVAEAIKTVNQLLKSLEVKY
jgi:hypothetical protein